MYWKFRVATKEYQNCLPWCCSDCLCAFVTEFWRSKSNLYMVDRAGVIHSEREDLNQYKAQFINDGGARTLMEAMSGADVFVGLASANLLPAEYLPVQLRRSITGAERGVAA
ncbi:hypothetical protein [Pseudomonas chlororaphis]|uniref:hypothetical protein n=1 Tax=Pseudomonas chlororaphis TaxID=587753 RepID=UPI0018B016FB|nr:hypothetical protein [Pseudomonas chlororaphis]